MRVTLMAVGKARGPLEDAIREYERRAGRYFRFETVELRGESAGGGRGPREVMALEGERILARARPEQELVALDRAGERWSSEALADHLGQLGLHGADGVQFVIGGAFGLDEQVLRRANRSLSLSEMTLPHDLARLVLAEQIYRAGTILRGEPYHKGAVA